MGADASDTLAGRARTSPDRVALVYDDDGREWTYADLDAAVAETAGRLVAAGVAPGAGDHVGVLMETRPAFARLALATRRLGAALVPLNARLAVPELRRQREVADLSVLVCEAATEADAVEAAGEVPVASVDDPGGGAAPLRDRDPAAFDPPPLASGDRQALLFTSGTTGDPKAVELTAGNLAASAEASAYRLGVVPGDRWCSPLSMYHMGGLAPLLRSVRYGTAVVLRREFDEPAVLDALAARDCTGVSLVPTMLRRLLDAGDLPDSLRFVLLGGAPAPAELVDRCEREGVPVCPTYGMTETASQVATARPAEAFAHRGTVGRPLFGTTVTVVDEGGDPVPVGEPGELVVDGPTVTPGYYGDGAATDAAFGPRGLHTGDVGYRDGAGRLWVLNRRSDRIVTGGENVHPGEVVEALRAHPAVRDAAVVGLDDPEWGERVAALVVSEADGDEGEGGDGGEGAVDEAALDAHCRERLAGFEVPKTLAFASELPRTASGTVDREAVRERLRRAADL